MSFLQKTWEWSKIVGLSASVLWTGIIGLLVYFQEKIIFHPDKPYQYPEHNPVPYQSPSNLGIPYESVVVSTRDGEKIHMWFMYQKRPSGTFVYFQGNAGNMGLRLPFFEMIYRMGFNVLSVSYRGYGHSTGVPCESGLFLDAEAALAFLIRRSGVNLPNNVTPDLKGSRFTTVSNPSYSHSMESLSTPNPTRNSSESLKNPVDLKRIYLFGRSLGGAVALRTAAAYPKLIAAVVVENTFTSIGDMASAVFPLLRFLSPLIPFLLRVNFKSIKSVNDVVSPCFFISGQRDELVPSSQMELLAKTCKSVFKQIYRVPGGNHNETWRQAGADYPIALAKFIENATEKQHSVEEKIGTSVASDVAITEFFQIVGPAVGSRIDDKFNQKLPYEQVDTQTVSLSSAEEMMSSENKSGFVAGTMRLRTAGM